MSGYFYLIKCQSGAVLTVCAYTRRVSLTYFTDEQRGADSVSTLTQSPEQTRAGPHGSTQIQDYCWSQQILVGADRTTRHESI